MDGKEGRGQTAGEERQQSIMTPYGSRRETFPKSFNTSPSLSHSGRRRRCWLLAAQLFPRNDEELRDLLFFDNFFMCTIFFSPPDAPCQDSIYLFIFAFFFET